jgi:fructose-bisphosphate aldolase class I
MTQDLQSVAAMLVTDGKGILAVDETVPTLTKRFDKLGIESTEQSRRTYREMLFTPVGLSEFISAAILHDETFHQKSANGVSLTEVLSRQGIVPDIKVDAGAKPFAGSPGETVTRGSTDFAIACRPIARRVLALRNGEPSFASAMHGRARHV